MDLFFDSLQPMTFSDVANFLAIGAPEEERPTEGPRIDLKLKAPDDLCDTVAAFANTFGGLIFVGVESSKKKNNIPTSIPGYAFAGGDVRASLAGKITSQVMPRPDFDIGVAPVPNSGGNVVAVIRVREGAYPPYQFTSGDKVRFPIRVLDTTKMATLRDIEQMFKKRDAFAESSETRIQALFQPPLIPTYVESSIIRCPSPVRASSSYHFWALRPRTLLRVRLDRAFEREFHKLIETAFPDSRFGEFKAPLLSGFSHVIRWQTQINCSGSEDLVTLVRYFECSADGNIRFAERIDRHSTGTESISDLFIASLHFLDLAEKLYSALAYFGSLSALQTLQCQPEVEFRANFPSCAGRYEDSGAIVFPTLRPSEPPARSNRIEEIPAISSCNRAEFVCNCLLAHLRELRFATVDYALLLETVSKLPTDVLPYTN